MLLQPKRIAFAICFIFPCKNKEYRRGNCEDFTKILFKPYSEGELKLSQVWDFVLKTLQSYLSWDLSLLAPVQKIEYNLRCFYISSLSNPSFQ